ncbi:hypothetical protein ABZZ74_23370 [Streptomyces sp. NPDC006476]|uniref:hypothetical protein n=1 Tax=Streptomyces sp. NPDC006476 TaxID=3157175 RepID=UPI0033A3C985
MEVLACFTVEDRFDLSPGYPDTDGAGLYASGARCFPKVAEVSVALELSEVDFEPVGVGVGDHSTSPGYEKAPAGWFTAGAPEACCDSCATIKDHDYSFGTYASSTRSICAFLCLAGTGFCSWPDEHLNGSAKAEWSSF